MPLEYVSATKLRAPSGRIFRIYDDRELEALLDLGWSLIYAEEESPKPQADRTRDPAPAILPPLSGEQPENVESTLRLPGVS